MTDRDLKVVEFISKCPCSSKTIQKLFFPSERTCNRRLNYLFKFGYLKRYRDTNWDNYYYYVKKPEHFNHYDCIARSYLWIMQQGYKIYNFEVQKQYATIRPDLIVEIEKDGKKGTLAVEVELSNNDIHKKIKQYEESEFKKLLLVSPVKRSSSKINIINLNLKELP